MTVVVVAIPSIIFAVAATYGWVCYLKFCERLVDKTGRSSSLRDAAAIASAYRPPWIIRRRRGQ
jgi:hypothetical protein